MSRTAEINAWPVSLCDLIWDGEVLWHENKVVVVSGGILFHPLFIYFPLLNSCVFQWIFSWRWRDRLHQASLSPPTLSCLTDRYHPLQACRETVLRLCARLLFIIHEQNIGFLYSLLLFQSQKQIPPRPPVPRKPLPADPSGYPAPLPLLPPCEPSGHHTASAAASASFSPSAAVPARCAY